MQCGLGESGDICFDGLETVIGWGEAAIRGSRFYDEQTPSSLIYRFIALFILAKNIEVDFDNQ